MSRKKIVIIILSVVLVLLITFSVIDLDNDGLMNFQEFMLSSDISKLDCDYDGLTDGQEAELGTNPKVVDSDGDKLLDGNSILLSISDELSGKLKTEQIIYRVKPNGIYEFYGEQYFNSNPCEISANEANQAKFLASISDQEYNQLEIQGKLLNNNLDGDQWSNYFEKQISNTPYDVKNDVYVIMMTMAGHDYQDVDDMFKALGKMNIPQNHIYDLSDVKNNPIEFQAAVDSVAKKATNNDIVLIAIGGHGNKSVFSFKNGDNVNYKWFSENIEKINSNKVVIVDSCESGAAIKDLQGMNRIILTSSTDDQKAGGGITLDFLNSFSNKFADTNQNNYVSIGEAADYAKKIRTLENTTPQISDVGNLGSTSYFVEYQLFN